jgi:hypothetical protein
VCVVRQIGPARRPEAARSAHVERLALAVVVVVSDAGSGGGGGALASLSRVRMSRMTKKNEIEQ